VNVIEERIRAATRAAAGTVPPDSVPPLELAAAPQRRRLGGGRFRGGRSAGAAWSSRATRLAPAAAALAVIAIAFTVAALNQTKGGSSASSATAAGPHVPAGPPVSTYVRSGQVPPYFVTRTPSDAVVHLTDGGATVATIRPSRPGGKVVAVTAAGDDRTFVLAEQAKFSLVAEFYQVRLSASGHPGAPTRLPMSVADVKTMTDMALSPDGTRLAIAVALGGGLQQVRLYSVHSGSARTWSATGSGTIGGRFPARSLSWAASQRTLAFNWSIHQTETVRLLDIGNSGGSLLAASQPTVMLAATTEPGRIPYRCLDDMLITPNGSAIVCPGGEIRNAGKNGTITYSTGFPEFSVTTGSLIRITGHWPQKGDDPYVYDLIWSDASGQVLIGAITSAGRDWVGVISGNRFTPLSNQQSLGAYQFGTW